MKPETAERVVEWMDRVYDPTAHIQRQTENFKWAILIVATGYLLVWLFNKLRAQHD